ncbi:unnamed protein product [Pleuronectes platessa]|uniref:Uncharacterized protein n=1 Tax=Pleuronectes platessa TaxID=8262 RepID=A0A9N7TZG9_PLEPL|nr:unnamed protein product [Pleuronectes platessa]
MSSSECLPKLCPAPHTLLPGLLGVFPGLLVAVSPQQDRLSGQVLWLWFSGCGSLVVVLVLWFWFWFCGSGSLVLWTRSSRFSRTKTQSLVQLRSRPAGTGGAGNLASGRGSEPDSTVEELGEHGEEKISRKDLLGVGASTISFLRKHLEQVTSVRSNGHEETSGAGNISLQGGRFSSGPSVGHGGGELKLSDASSCSACDELLSDDHQSQSLLLLIRPEVSLGGS